jgi:heptosyltransferase-1
MSAGPVVELAGFKSVFLVKPSSLGDIVHTLPAARFLKQSRPHLQIRWICNPEWMPLLEGNPDLTEVIPFPRRELGGLWAPVKFLLWARRLNAQPRELPEITLDFQGLLRSGLIALARGNDPVIGMSDAREGSVYLQRATVRVDKEAHAVDRYLTLVRALGASAPPERAEFPLPAGSPPLDVTLPEKFLVLHPFSRGRGKSLTPECLQTLCECLAPKPIVVVGRGDFELDVKLGPHVTSLVNQTSLLELMWLLRRAHGCVSVDSGPMHMAAAVNARTLGIHTWSDPRKVGPYPATAVVWKAGRIARRDAFTDEEAADDRKVATGDCRRIADFIHGWYLD